jgi:DNA integrity scanning protein DisA with diadenylate cyclase activity
MEGKVERILSTLLRVQSLMNGKESNEDIVRAISEIRREIGSNSGGQVLSLQITELVEKFAKSSETLLKDLKIMSD